MPFSSPSAPQRLCATPALPLLCDLCVKGGERRHWLYEVQVPVRRDRPFVAARIPLILEFKIKYKCHTYTCLYALSCYCSPMAQLTIYLDATTQKIVEAAAAQEGKSLSRWARERLQDAVQRSSATSSLSDFYGSIKDDSFREPPDLPATSDTKRETFD
ncbi:hypothetical protein BH09VER1_BH09VER1_54260 [soil metagenome]